MDKKELLDVLQAAYNSGDDSDAIAALDRWEAANDRKRNNLSFLRFHREQLDQIEIAASIAREMLQYDENDVATQLSDSLSLGRLYLRQDKHRDAWDCVSNVLESQELPDFFSVGMARSAVELCMDIAIGTADRSLAAKSFNGGMELLEAGSSVSPIGLSKAREAAKTFQQVPRFEAYCESARSTAP